MNTTYQPHQKPVQKKDDSVAAGFVDGIDHINIWIKGETDLGRSLSYFYYSPFQHPYFGPFNSMQGFWHFIRSRERPDELRRLSGIKAKNFGRNLEEVAVDGFFEIIEAANYYKIVQSPRLKELIIESSLPFEHYYYYGPGNLLVRPSGWEWVISSFEKLRGMIRDGVEPPALDYGKLIKQT